jgi:hypothetical protein
MRELRSEEIGDRRVALVETGTEQYSVTIAYEGRAEHGKTSASRAIRTWDSTPPACASGCAAPRSRRARSTGTT